MRPTSLVLIAAALSACAADAPSLGSYAGAVISDAVHDSGTAGFYWLPPMVAAPSPTGMFEPAAAPTVEVIRPDTNTVVRTLVPTLGTDQFHANWDTKAQALDPSVTYRVQVRVPDGRVIGFADIDVVDTGAQVKGVDTAQYVGLVDGRTLPIKFRIERAAVDGDADGVLDWNDNCATTPNADQADTLGDGVGDACRCQVLTCDAPDACHVATCSAQAGCQSDVVPDGTTCGAASSCRAGVCTADRCDPLTLGPATAYVTGAGPQMVRAADLNHDGKLDLVTGDYTQSQVSVMLNGGGSFTRAGYFANHYIVYISTGDVNNDGAIDVVATNYVLGELNLMLGNGDGTLQPRIVLPIATAYPGVISAELGDANGDGKLDLAVGHTDASFDIMLGDGGGGFAFLVRYDLSAPYERPVASRFGDLDHDGLLDLVVANQGTKVAVLMGHGDGTFAAPARYGTANYPQMVELGDLDGDGDLDIVAGCNIGEAVTTLLNTGTGVFGSRSDLSVADTYGHNPWGITVGDFDHDGQRDVAVARRNSSQVPVYIGNGDGTFAATPAATVGVSSTDLLGAASGDFDNDDKLDLAVIGIDARLHVSLNTCP